MNTRANHLPPTNGELPPPEQIFSWAEDAAQNQEWLIAAQRWSVLRKAYPSHPAPWLQGINAYIESNQFEKAEQLLKHAQQHFPQHPNTLIYSAALDIRLKNFDRAEELLSHARNRYPYQILSWMKSAELEKIRGNLNQAAEYYQSAIQHTPDYPAPWIEHAELAMQSEKWDVALTRWECVRKHFPNLSAGYHRAAEAARQLNRPQESRHLILSHEFGTELTNNNVIAPPSQQRTRNHSNTSQYLELIWTKAVFNLRSEVQRNYLSYGWWLLEPLLHMVVYYIVFGILLKRGGGDFPVFLLTGLIPWMWFMKAVSNSSNSIIQGQNLLLQVGIPSIILPLINILQITLKQLPVFLLLFGFAWFQGYPPGSHWLSLLAVIGTQLLLTIVIACAVAAVIPFVRDLAYLVPTGLTFLMFLSGIFYDYRIIPTEYHELFLMNPIAFLITSYREIIMNGTSPNFSTLSWWLIGSGTACLFLILAYKRLRFIYPRIVME
jgi:lipopolysaccharide transport system permease protein